MNHDDLESLLSGAFDAHARASVPDAAATPEPRFENAPDVAAVTGLTTVPGPAAVTGRGMHRAASRRGTPDRPLRHRRFLAPLSAAAAVVLAVSVAVVALRSGSGQNAAAAHGSGTNASRTVAGAKRDVHVRLVNGDGDTYGVGMPVIAYFSQKITDARAFQRATTATVNGKPVAVAWYFEPSRSGYPLEAHLRAENYWPAKSKIHVMIAAKGLSAGDGMRFDDSLTLDFSTGLSQIATVSNHTLSLSVDGKPPTTYPVSVGGATTPTMTGTKVIMEKDRTFCVEDQPAMTACRTVQYAQRLTYGGEFLLAAPWNIADIKAKVDSSQGSVDLIPTDAKTLYDTLQVGDVVVFKGTGGAPMRLGNGYGDWTVNWHYWLTGGSVPTH